MQNGNMLASLLAIIAVEYFFHVPFIPQLKALSAVAKKSTWLMTSRHVSDAWKEIVLLRYAKEIMKSSIFLALILFGFTLLAASMALLLDMWINPTPSTMDALADPFVWLYMTLTAFAYLYCRKYFAGN